MTEAQHSPLFVTDRNLPVILTKGSQIHFSARYLQTEQAQAWVGWGADPRDNKNQRVHKTRALMAQCYDHIPYGMGVGNRPDPQKKDMVPMTVNALGFYELDTSWWPTWIYRVNFQSLPNIPSPVGTPLKPRKRDFNVSWPQDQKLWSDEALQLAKPYLHTETNGAGWCFRIMVDRYGNVIPYGDI